MLIKVFIADTCISFTILFVYNQKDDFLVFSADFGLSKIASNDVQMSTVCGTPGYCGEIQILIYCIVSKTLVLA